MKHKECPGCGEKILSGRLVFFYSGEIICWKCKWYLIKEKGMTEHQFKQVKEK